MDLLICMGSSPENKLVSSRMGKNEVPRTPTTGERQSRPDELATMLGPVDGRSYQRFVFFGAGPFFRA
jgi:hypothetical protein